MEKLKTTQKLMMVLSILMAVTGLYAQSVPTNGLVGYFSFDALSSGSVIADSGSAAGNVGTLVGSGTALTNDSKLGTNALAIDPTNGDSYVEFDLDNSSDFIFSGSYEISVSLWIKPERLLHTDKQKFLSLNSGYGGNTYMFEITNNHDNSQSVIKTEIALVKPVDIYENANAAAWGNPLSLSTWVHVAFTYDGTNVKLYMDGVEVRNQTGNWDNTYGMVTWANQLFFGAKRHNAQDVTDDQFKGSIDELYIYNSTLTSSEVEDLFNHGNGGVATVDGVEATTLSVQPNPATDLITINNINETVSYKVISITGSVLLTGETDGNVNISSLAAGTYILQVGGKKAVKFVKQ